MPTIPFIDVSPTKTKLAATLNSTCGLEIAKYTLNVGLTFSVNKEAVSTKSCYIEGDGNIPFTTILQPYDLCYSGTFSLHTHFVG